MQAMVQVGWAHTCPSRLLFLVSVQGSHDDEGAAETWEAAWEILLLMVCDGSPEPVHTVLYPIEFLSMSQSSSAFLLNPEVKLRVCEGTAPVDFVTLPVLHPTP
jgi:hypothetical protein